MPDTSRRLVQIYTLFGSALFNAAGSTAKHATVIMRLYTENISFYETVAVAAFTPLYREQSPSLAYVVNCCRFASAAIVRG